MADPFEGTNGPGEQTHEGFKLFGLSVNQFSAAVAGIDTLGQMLNKQMNKSGREAADQQRVDSNIAESQNEAAQTQIKAAEINEDIAKESQKAAVTNSKNMLNIWQTIQFKFMMAIESFKENTKSGFQNIFGEMKGVLGTLGDVFKQFAARFIVIFTVVNLLTRVLEILIEANNAQARSRRRFGTAFAEGFGQAGFQDAQRAIAATGREISSAEILDFAAAFNSEMRDSSKISTSLLLTIENTARAFNVDLNTAAAFFGRAMRTTDATAKDVQVAFADIGLMAAELRLNVDELVSDLASTPELAQQWVIATQQGRIELARTVAEARLLNTNLADLRQVGDTFTDLPKAVEEASRLATLGVRVTATELITAGAGSTADAMGAIKGILFDLSRTFRGLDASVGADRRVLQEILSSSESLGQLFTVETLAEALEFANKSGDRSLDALLKTAAEEATPVRNFERKALAQQADLVRNGQTLEEILNSLAAQFAGFIADFLRPAFETLIKLVRWIAKTVAGWLKEDFDEELFLTPQEIQAKRFQEAQDNMIPVLAKDAQESILRDYRAGILGEAIDPIEISRAVARENQKVREAGGTILDAEDMVATQKKIQAALETMARYEAEGRTLKIIGADGRAVMRVLELPSGGGKM